MAGFLDQFRQNVVTSLWKDKPEEPKVKDKDIDDKIALGVLLWVVAEADKKFLPDEEKKIKEILVSYGKISEKDLPIVLATVKQAAKERVGLQRFTSEVSGSLPYSIKISIIETLFRVACVDKDLDYYETETMAKIANLFHIDHKDFIDAKMRIKKEYGIKKG